MKLELLGYQQKISTQMPMHSHLLYEIHYITHGRGLYFCGEQQLQLQAGDFFITPPGLMHVIRPRDGEWTSQYLCIVELESAEEKQLFTALKKLGYMDGVHALGLSHVANFEKSLVWHRSNNETFQAGAKIQLLNFLYHCCDRKIHNPNAQEYLLKVLQMLQQKSSGAIQLEETANSVGVSHAHLSRAFKKEFGVSPQKYHSQLRMELACRYLEDQTWTLSTIADKLGFQNEFNLSRAFKKCIGLAPDHYRKKWMGNVKEASLYI